MQSVRNPRKNPRPGATARRVALLIILAGGVMVLVSIGSREHVGPVDRVLSQVTVPVISAGRDAGDQLGGLTGWFLRLWSTPGYVATLEQENRKLREENLRYHAVVQELRDLQSQLEIATRLPFDIIPAAVLIHDVDSMLEAVVINRGSRDHVSVQMPVLADGAVVGTVERVLPGAARVLLITDAGSAVGVMVVRSNVRGVLYGSPSRRASGLQLELERAQPDDVRPGDEIVTAQESTIFPPGLPVGKVVMLVPPAARDRVNAIVRPAVDLDAIRIVQVVVSIDRRDAIALAEKLPLAEGRRP